MGVVHLFGQRKPIESTDSVAQVGNNDNAETGSVVELVVNQKIAHGVPAKTVYKQLEAMLVSNGVDFTCEKVKADYKIVTYLVQGIMDRGDGISSDRCLMLDTLRHALAYEEPVNTHDDTNELFGDLLGRLD